MTLLPSTGARFSSSFPIPPFLLLFTYLRRIESSCATLCPFRPLVPAWTQPSKGLYSGTRRAMPVGRVDEATVSLSVRCSFTMGLDNDHSLHSVLSLVDQRKLESMKTDKSCSRSTKLIDGTGSTPVRFNPCKPPFLTPLCSCSLIEFWRATVKLLCLNSRLP